MSRISVMRGDNLAGSEEPCKIIQAVQEIKRTRVQRIEVMQDSLKGRTLLADHFRTGAKVVEGKGAP